MASEKEKQSRSEHKEKDSARSHAKDHETKSESRSHSKEHESKSESRSHSKDHESRAENRDHESHSDKSGREHESKNKSNRGSKEHESKLAPGKSARTTDHDTIRRWVEERGGSPATVKATESGDDPGLLRINFPGYSGANRLEDISWEDFFKKFDEKDLEFLYQDETRNGETSRFWKFVSRSGDDKK